jgi:hypothetical protein
MDCETAYGAWVARSVGRSASLHAEDPLLGDPCDL